MKTSKAFFLGFAAVLAGCSLGGTASPSSSAKGDSAAVLTKQFEADGGAYVFQTNDVNNRGQTFLFSSNAVSTSEYPLEVTVSKLSGGAAGGYGVIFARQDANDFWFADIDVASNYAVGKVASGVITYLTSSGSSTWVSSAALSPGYGVPNTIKVGFDGSKQYTLYFNDTQAFQFSDTAAVPSTCGFGFNVGVLSTENFPDKPVSVSFTVKQPSGLTFPVPSGGSSEIAPGRLVLGARR